MNVDRIWAGWRSAYVMSMGAESTPAPECLFCALAAGDPAERYVVAADEVVFVVLNAYPYTCGHMMVVPRRHEAELDGLTPSEASALMVMTQRATTALKAAYSPEGINVGLNLGRSAGAGVPGHVHVHVLPRWSADTNFMTSVAEARVLPEDLRTSWERLRSAWPA